MEQSHPNRWLYGGVLQRITWEGDGGQVQLWDGRRKNVEPGDRLLILRTAVWAQVVKIERPESPVLMESA